MSFFAVLQDQFYQSFILKDRYMNLVLGLENTLIITVFAVLLGVLLGTGVALVRVSHANNPGKLRILNGICTL